MTLLEYTLRPFTPHIEDFLVIHDLPVRSLIEELLNRGEVVSCSPLWASSCWRDEWVLVGEQLIEHTFTEYVAALFGNKELMSQLDWFRLVDQLLVFGQVLGMKYGLTLSLPLQRLLTKRWHRKLMLLWCAHNELLSVPTLFGLLLISFEEILLWDTGTPTTSNPLLWWSNTDTGKLESCPFQRHHVELFLISSCTTAYWWAWLSHVHDTISTVQCAVQGMRARDISLSLNWVLLEGDFHLFVRYSFYFLIRIIIWHLKVEFGLFNLIPFVE